LSKLSWLSKIRETNVFLSFKAGDSQGWLFLNPLLFSIFLLSFFFSYVIYLFYDLRFWQLFSYYSRFSSQIGATPTPLAALLTITLLAILSQKQGLRDFARFVQANAQTLTTLFHLKHGVPKYATFQSLFSHRDAQVLTDKFVTWLTTYSPVLADKYISLDGKAVQSTVSGGNTSLQNFISVVSAFGQQSGLTHGMQAFQNNKSGEGQALRDLVEKLGLQDKVYTADALLEGGKEELCEPLRTFNLVISSNKDIDFCSKKAICSDCWAINASNLEIYRSLCITVAKIRSIC
jgi:DDE_Tnp_1-associated